MDCLNEYLSENHVPSDLRNEVRAYFIHSRDLRKELSYKTVLTDLSAQLYGKLSLFVYSTAVRQIPFFSIHSSVARGEAPFRVQEENKAFVAAIAMKLEPVSFGPLEDVIGFQEQARAMFVIRNGLAAKSGGLLHKGTFFGHDMLLTTYKRPYSVKSLTFLDCFKLSKQDLTELFATGRFPLTQKSVRRFTVRLAIIYKMFPVMRLLRYGHHHCLAVEVMML